MMIKSLNKTLLLTMVLIASQSILAQEKNPLDNIDVTKAMMHLDWASMSYFDDKNKAVDPEKNDGRVVFMGNSITQGWMQYMPKMFDNDTYINRGIGGQTTPQMLLRFRQDVIAHQPKAVVILAGTNDIAGNTPLKDLETVAGYLFSMAELARQHNIKVILCSVVPAAEYPWRKGKRPDVKIPQLNKMIQDYCNETDIHYLDYFSAMTDGKNGLIESYGYDGVHPDEDGYKVMTELVEKALDQLLDR
jgi:lysophospholipase L1-like esterase